MTSGTTSGSYSSYRGDSPGKRIARARLWMKALRDEGNFAPVKGALVLAGEGGDLGVLKSLGADMSTVHACDFDNDWLDYCNEVYPGAHMHHGEAGAESKLIYFNHAHLDWCNWLKPENIRTFADIVQNIQKPGCIIVTMQKGREMPTHKWRDAFFDGIPRPVRRQALRFVRKHATADWKNPNHIYRLDEHILDRSHDRPFDASHIIGICEDQARRFCYESQRNGLDVKIFADPTGQTRYFTPRSKKLAPFGQAMVRMDALKTCAEVLLSLRKKAGQIEEVPYILQGSTLTYHSCTEKSQGSAFVSTLFMVGKAYMQPAFLSWVRAENPFVYEHWNKEDSMKYLKPVVLQFASTLPDANICDLFDVTEENIAQWREEQERGEIPEGRLPIHLTATGSAASLRDAQKGLRKNKGDA